MQYEEDLYRGMSQYRKLNRQVLSFGLVLIVAAHRIFLPTLPSKHTKGRAERV